MEFQKIVNFLDIPSDNKDLPKFVTKKLTEVYDQSEKRLYPNKEVRIKTSMLRSDLCDHSDVYIIVKELLLSLIQKMQKEIKQYHLKIMHHLLIVSQKLMV